MNRSQAGELRIAKPLVRVAAFFIDACSIALLGYLIAVVVGLGSDGPPAVVSTLVGIAVMFGYLVASDAGSYGATLGKRLLKLRVVGVDGDRISVRRAVVRRLVFFPGAWALYVGWLWIFFDHRRQAWHDKAAKTLVVRTR